eukprot:Clim_evm4s231 gene=Clim_evmTU4s231
MSMRSSFDRDGVDLSQVVFRKYDRDKDGSIDAKELDDMCYDMGTPLNPDEIAYVFTQLDKDKSGKIDYDEFKAFWRTKDRWNTVRIPHDKEDRLNSVTTYFKHFDTNKDGTLSEGEFVHMVTDMQKNGWQIPDGSQLFKDIDMDDNKSISLSEYIAHLVKIGSF